MSCINLKVGDRVAITDPGACSFYYKKGAEGVVVELVDNAARIRFISGDFCTLNNGLWWVGVDQLAYKVPYSSTFTKKAATEPNRGHTTDGGGLQKHSVGNAYPLSIVGYATGGTVTYRIENLTTEVVFGNVHKPLAWADIHTATWMLTLWLKHGNKLGGIAWHPRKPNPELAGY